MRKKQILTLVDFVVAVVAMLVCIATDSVPFAMLAIIFWIDFKDGKRSAGLGYDS